MSTVSACVAELEKYRSFFMVFVGKGFITCTSERRWIWGNLNVAACLDHSQTRLRLAQHEPRVKRLRGIAVSRISLHDPSGYIVSPKNTSHIPRNPLRAAALKARFMVQCLRFDIVPSACPPHPPPPPLSFSGVRSCG